MVKKARESAKPETKAAKPLKGGLDGRKGKEPIPAPAAKPGRKSRRSD